MRRIAAQRRATAVGVLVAAVWLFLGCAGGVPLASASPSEMFKAVSAGFGFACGIRTNDTVVCWGPDSEHSPPSGTFKTVSAGAYNTCAIRVDNTIACWGDNSVAESSPPSGTFKAVRAGGSPFACGIRTDDTVACWGDN